MGTTARVIDNGDGTLTDNATGLMSEFKLGGNEETVSSFHLDSIALVGAHIARRRCVLG